MPMLARLVPEWRENASDRAEELIVLQAEAVLRVLRVFGGARTGLLVLEDLYWADPETMAALEYLTDKLVSEPVACLCTVRSEGPARRLRSPAA